MNTYMYVARDNSSCLDFAITRLSEYMKSGFAECERLQESNHESVRTNYTDVGHSYTQCLDCHLLIHDTATTHKYCTVQTAAATSVDNSTVSQCLP